MPVAADPLPTVTYKLCPPRCRSKPHRPRSRLARRRATTSPSASSTGWGYRKFSSSATARARPAGRSRRARPTPPRCGITTGELNQRVSVPGAFNPLQFDPQLTIERGGVPINVDKETVGAIAVSGAPGGDKDEACAQAGIAKISDRLK